MKKTSLIVVLIFSLIVSALSASAAFDFYGNTYYENGTVLVGVNVTIEVYNMSGMMDQEIDVVSVLSNSTGGFNLSAIAEATGEDEYIYQIIVVKYDNGYADYVGKSLPMLDIDMINSLGEMDFFLRPGVTINITAYNSTGGIEPFQYIFKDSKLGYPIGQYVGEPYLNNVLIDAAEGRNYSFILYFNETMPLQYELNNISDYTGNHISLEFNVSDVPTVVSGSVFLADENYSVEPDLDTLEFVGFILEPGNTIFEMSMLPYNMGLWGGGQGDEINATTGDFDITLIHPGNDLDIMMVFVGYDSFDDEDFITYQNITIGPEINISNISIPIYNASGESDYVFEVDDGNHNVTSLGVNFSLQNTTGGAIESAFVTATLDYSDLIGMDVKWVVDIQENEENLTETGKFSLPLIEGYDLKMEIFSNEYAPKKTKIASSRYYSEPIVINLTEFDPGVIDGNLNDSDIYLDMLKYSDECNVPNYDRDACSLFPSNQSMENFNPFKLVLGGAKMNFVIGNKINGMEVVYLDVDLLASGPPDALFDAGADSNQTGDEITEAWTFAGNGPEIYEEVLIAVPFDQDFDPETINFSMPLLYDENLDVVWNASVNDTGDLPEEYEDFPEELFNGTMCDPSNLSATCYVNSTEFMAWFKMPHFSGGEAQFSGSEQVDITFTKTRVGASQINNGSKVTFILNVTNTGSDNLTDYSIFDEYNGTLLDFNNETSLNYTDYNATESNIEWTFNLSAGASQVIEVNFTAIAVGNATNFAEFQNSTEHTFANASATVEIVLAPSIVFTKTLVSDYQVINERKVILNGSKVTFILNVTNNGAENLTDYSIFDEYNYSGSFFNFNEEVSLNYSDYNESEDYIEWTFNLSAGSSQVIEINFTAIAVGNATNFAEFQNSTEHTFANASATVEIIIDSTPPTWNEDPQGSTIQYNTLFIYDVNASDNYQIDDYFINDTGNFSIGSEDGVITNNTLLALGVYYLNVSVNDTSNNVNSTIIAITVEDTIPPEWNETPQNLIIQYAASFSYQVNASDNNAIDKYFIDDDGNFTIVANTGVITNHTLLSMGVYSLNISVNDTSNHITSTIITITVQDLVYPTWNQTPANQVVEYNTSFSYQVNASDNNEVDKYFIDDETNFAIDSNSGIITNYTLLGIGIYSLNISVNDTSNNINSTVINITVQDTTYPAWDETPQSSTIQYGASFMYDVNATDALLDQYFVNDSTNFNIAGNGIITNATTLVPGVISLNISVNDTSGNTNSSVISVTVQDTTPPTWDQVPQDQTVKYNTSFSYDVNATDNYQIDDYFINGTDFSIDTDGIITNNTLLALGVYYLNVSVNDTSGNTNSSVISVTVQDTTPPTWIQNPTNQTVEYNTSFSYQVNASDNNAIDEYFINDTGNFSIVSNTGVITNNTLLDFGTYSLNISVNDTSGNTNSTIITITVQDMTYPTWNQTPANQEVEYNTSFSYQVNASDTNEVDKYFIDDETNFAIDSNSGIITNYTLLGIGLYSLNISVNDTSNNINSTVINITVQDTTYPAWDETPQSSTIQYGASFMYDVNATEALLDQYFINDSSNFAIVAENGIIINATTLAPGVISFNISVNDTSGNTNSTVISVTVQDTIPPTWDESLQNQTVEYNTSFSYDVNATDNYQTDDYFINDTDFSIDTDGIITNNTLLSLGVYYLNISVNDTSNNVNSTIITITVEDTTYPIWTQTPVNQNAEWNILFSYDVNATDALLDKYSINDTDFSIVSGTGVITNNTLLDFGSYSLNISVNDTSNNVNSTIITVTVSDTTNPELTQPSNQTINYGVAFGLQIVAADNHNLSSYSVDDSTNFAINSSGYLSNNTLLSVGTYSLTITVSDSSSNQNSSSMDVTVQLVETANAPANVSTDIDLSEADANMTIYLEDNVTTVEVIVQEETATPNGTTASLTGVKAIDITVDSSTSGNLTWAEIRIYYSDADISGLDEANLKMYFYNTSAGDWQLADPQGVNAASNYIWANVTHFSVWGIFGSAPVAAEEEEESSSSSSSGGMVIRRAQLGDEPKTITLRTVDKVTFNIEEESHTAQIRRIYTDYVIMNVHSFAGVDVNLSLDKTEKVDVNEDGTYDLAMTLIDSSRSSAKITFEKIAESTTAIPEEVIPEEEPEPIPEEIITEPPVEETVPEAAPIIEPIIEEPPESKSKAWMWIVGIIVIAAIIIGAVFWQKKRNE